MPSSISSSEHNRQAGRWLARLLIALLIVAAAMEAGTRVGFIKSSRIQRRIHGEYVAAKSIQPANPAGRPTVLLVGNSLLLADVDMATLGADMADTLSPSRYAIENTQFLDWYFALQRLFREGVRPGRVVLALSTNQLISRSVYGEYFGHYMMGGRNVIDVAHETGYTTTEASNLLFANWSAWFGSKSEIRKWIAGHFIPDSGQLAGLMAGPAPARPPLRESSGLIETRMRHLRDIGLDADVEISFLLVPDPKASDDDVEVVRSGGEKAGIRVLTPVAMKEIPLPLYSDGFHLNEKGATVFTAKLAPVLRQWAAVR